MPNVVILVIFNILNIIWYKALLMKFFAPSTWKKGSEKEMEGAGAGSIRTDVKYENKSIQGAVDAYVVIRALVKGSRPSTANGKNSSKNLLRWWTDVTTIHCARKAGFSGSDSFFRVLDVAFGGQLLDNRELLSQMQQPPVQMGV